MDTRELTMNKAKVENRILSDSLAIFEICKLNQHNCNNHMYTSPVIQAAIGRLRSKGVVRGHIGMPKNAAELMVSATDTLSHEVLNLRIENDILVGNVRPLNTPHGKILKGLIKSDHVAFALAGIANLDKDGVVRNLKIISINAIDKSIAV